MDLSRALQHFAGRTLARIVRNLDCMDNMDFMDKVSVIGF